MVGNGMESGVAADPMQDQAAAIGAAAQSKMRRAFYRAQDAYGRAAFKAREAGRHADRLISEQTYPSLAVAAAAGLALGMAIGFLLGARD